MTDDPPVDDPTDDVVHRALAEWLRPHGLHISLNESAGGGAVTARIREFDITATGSDEDEAIEGALDMLTRFVQDALREGKPLPARTPAYVRVQDAVNG